MLQATYNTEFEIIYNIHFNMFFVVDHDHSLIYQHACLQDFDEDANDPPPAASNEVSEEVDETCVICMDTIKDPKRLRCGHVFCTECIDAQFVYKEACPTCGMVIGIIEGTNINCYHIVRPY